MLLELIFCCLFLLKFIEIWIFNEIATDFQRVFIKKK